MEEWYVFKFYKIFAYYVACVNSIELFYKNNSIEYKITQKSLQALLCISMNCLRIFFKLSYAFSSWIILKFTEIFLEY